MIGVEPNEYRTEVCLKVGHRPVEVVLPHGTSEGAGITVESLKATDCEARELYPADGFERVDVRWRKPIGSVCRTVKGHGNVDGLVTRSEVKAAEGLGPERELLFDRVVHSALVSRRLVHEMLETFAAEKGKVSARAIVQEHELLTGLCRAVNLAQISLLNGYPAPTFSFTLPSGHRVEVDAEHEWGPLWRVALTIGTGADRLTVVYQPHYQGREDLAGVTRTIWDAHSKRQESTIRMTGGRPEMVTHRGDALTAGQAAALRELQLAFDNVRLVAAR